MRDSIGLTVGRERVVSSNSVAIPSFNLWHPEQVNDLKYLCSNQYSNNVINMQV